MLTVDAVFDPAASVGPVPRALFGSFVEHMGRGIYTGIFEPGHAAADEDGFRVDVLELVRKMGVTIVRYPGGNFVSGYRWEDGVGPPAERPARLDLAWHSRETNAFGLDEFMRWTRKAGVEPMLAINLGTRGVREALDLLEYSNHRSGTELADYRVSNGAPEPHDIRRWCLGNELDGPWQLGHRTATEYARLATETARAMRQYDPTLRLVAAGSSAVSMPTFGDWERTVLAHAYELVDSISLHAYYEELDDLPSFMASAVGLDRYLDQVSAIADEVGTSLGSSKRLGLSVDEWNVWYMSRHQEQFHPVDWPEAPAISEDAYTLADAVVVGGLLISLLKHADRIDVACQAQLVNTLAPIKTMPGGKAWRESTYFPFATTAAIARGRAVPLSMTSPTMETETYGDVPVADAVGTATDDEAAASLFCVNRHLTETVELSVRMEGLATVEIGSAVVLTGPDVHATNTAIDGERVQLQPLEYLRIEQRTLRLSLPPVSWAAVALHRT